LHRGSLVWPKASDPVFAITQAQWEWLAAGARNGVTLSRSTLADWVGRLGVALQPLADRLAWHLWQRDCLHADETPGPHDCRDAGGRATQEPLPNSIPATAKPRKPTSGLIAVTTSSRGRRLSSLTIMPAAAAGMRSSF
jgi:hypothetical protein